jgi:hypothetical protein
LKNGEKINIYCEEKSLLLWDRLDGHEAKPSEAKVFSGSIYPAELIKYHYFSDSYVKNMCGKIVCFLA